MKTLVMKIKYENITLDEIEKLYEESGKDFECDADNSEVITEVTYS